MLGNVGEIHWNVHPDQETHNYLPCASYVWQPTR
jgi:hypothetical protein